MTARVVPALRRATIAIVLIACSAGPCAADDQALLSLEYPVKAAFLYQFTRFVEWPELAGGDKPGFCIGILGPDPFGGALERAIDGKQVGGRPLEVRRFRRVEDVQPCPILFVGIAEGTAVDAVMARARSWATLTVGETEAFMRAGGMIRFVVEKNRVSFEVDLETAERAGLKVSAQLFRVGRPVAGPRKAQR
jgi:hypothetical protein